MRQFFVMSIRRRWPLSLLVAFIAALTLSAWGVPILYGRYQLSGLYSNQANRRQAALNYIIAHAATSERVRNLATDAIGQLDADTAGKTYMALRRVNAARAPGVRVNLLEAYRDADHEAFTGLIRVLIADRAAAVPPVTNAILERIERVDDKSFEELVGLLREIGTWRREDVPLATWLRWTELSLASPLPAIRLAATTDLLDAACVPYTLRPTQATETVMNGELAAQLNRAVGDTDPLVRRGGAYATLAWDETILTRGLNAGEPLPIVEGLALIAEACPSESPVRFRDVVPPDAAPPAGNAPHGETDAAALRLLWCLESGRGPVDSESSADTLRRDAWPPLQRAVAATAEPEVSADALRQSLAADDPWIRAITTVLLADRAEASTTNRTAIELARSVDPVERQSAALLGLILNHPDQRRSLVDEAEWGSDNIRWVLLHTMGDDPSPQVRFLYNMNRQPSIGGPDRWHHDHFAGLLSQEVLPYPVVLVGLLGCEHRAGWDHLLGPFGLSDDELITLLDHYRFTWVLDALMPDDAPRFPLWVDRETQLEAVVAMRIWYARNRASWTHG
ncbi:MAG: hypothetical protein AAGH92_06455 [Planctomycetota bacterium]